MNYDFMWILLALIITLVIIIIALQIYIKKTAKNDILQSLNKFGVFDKETNILCLKNFKFLVVEIKIPSTYDLLLEKDNSIFIKKSKQQNLQKFRFHSGIQLNKIDNPNNLDLLIITYPSLGRIYVRNHKNEISEFKYYEKQNGFYIQTGFTLPFLLDSLNKGKL